MSSKNPDQNYGTPSGYVPAPPGLSPDAGEARSQNLNQGNATGRVNAAKPPTASSSGLIPTPYGPMTPQQWAALQAALTGAGGGAGGAGSSAAADLAEKKREFDVTTQRDIAKENASEVDALQKMISGMSGPKDVYGDLFFSHGFAAPQGYKPAPLPLTAAQIGAYKTMGVSPEQLQTMLTGNGQPGADAGMLGNLGSSLQPQPGQPGYSPAGSSQQTGPSNPTMQGGALYGKAPAGSSATGPAPTTPSMAVGGEVPGPTGDPRLVVAHGGEQIDNDTEEGELAPQNPGGVHPAIQKLMDALSELLANPDFQQYAGIAGKAASISRPPAKDGKSASPKDSPLNKMAPGPEVTPGGIQSMATGGTVAGPQGNMGMQPSPNPGVRPTIRPISGAGFNPAPPPGAVHPMPPSYGSPLGGAQAVTSNTGSQPADNPIMPMAKMDPYSRALYDIHGRLHPYSAQQLAQMGPQGQKAVESYVGKVEGGDVNAYTDLAKRLAPQGAPTATDSGGGFKFG